MGDFDTEGLAAGVGQAALNVATSLGLRSRIDPALSCNFTVEIDGLIVGGFAEVSGLEVTVNTFAYSEGGRNEYQAKFINGISYAPLILKRGLTTADMLWLWHRNVVAGNFKRRDGSIVLVTGDLTELWRWNFRQAFPTVWKGPSFRADTPAVAFESIELVHQGISKDMGAAGSATFGAAVTGKFPGAF